jgi:HEAT repeat protein
MSLWPRSCIVVVAFTSMIGIGAFTQDRPLASNKRLTTIEESLQRHDIALTRTALLDALRSSDAEVRWLAAQKLANDGAKDTVPSILEALTAEKVAETRVNIAYAVAQLGAQKGFATLKGTCDNPAIRADVRMVAATYMLNLHHEDCLSDVMTILQSRADPDSSVQALYLLPRFQQVSEDYLLKAILDALVSGTPAVRIAASNALGTVGNPSAIPFLQNAITKEQDEAVRFQMRTDLHKLEQKKGR